MRNHGYLYTFIVDFVKLKSLENSSFLRRNNVYHSENISGLTHDFAHYCLNLFYDLGIHTIFTIPGAHIEHFILAVAKDKRFKLVVSAHEEGAGFMADGYFRKSKQISLVATINGPGVTNLITAVSTAMMDHSSIIYLTGDAPLTIKDKLGFQTSNQDGCKSSEIMKLLINNQSIPTDSNQLFYALEEFYSNFKQGNHYPIHLNVHSDIFKKQILENHVINKHVNRYSIIDINLESYGINLSKSVFVLGEDLNNLNDLNSIIKLCLEHTIPIVCTLGAKNTQALIPSELYCGVYGYAGNASAVQLVSDEQIENIFFFGTELNERNTMAWSYTLFKKNRTIYSIRNQSQKDGIVEHPIIYIQDSIVHFIESLQSLNLITNDDSNWFIKHLYKPIKYNVLDRSTKLNMENCMMLMNKVINKTSNFFLDSGDHRIYGCKYWDVTNYNTFFTAAKNAPMGWAIAAGIGASFVDNSIATWVLTGDGCMLMHGNELAVAQRYQRNTKFIVINNGSYGRIELRLNKEEELTRNQISRLPHVSWTHYANSFNIDAMCVHTLGELEIALNNAQISDKPYLIEVMINIDNEISISEGVFSSTSPSFKLFWKEE